MQHSVTNNYQANCMYILCVCECWGIIWSLGSAVWFPTDHSVRLEPYKHIFSNLHQSYTIILKIPNIYLAINIIYPCILALLGYIVNTNFGCIISDWNPPDNFKSASEWRLFSSLYSSHLFRGNLFLFIYFHIFFMI